MKRVVQLAVCLVLMASGIASAQSTSTFNGRVLDQGDAVLPGVTVTVTNQATGVVRTTVTNGEGVYYLPGLDPGIYNITTESARVRGVESKRRHARDQRHHHARFQDGPGRGERGGHRDRRRPADRGDAVEGRLHHRADRAREPADDHAQRQRDAVAAPGGCAAGAGPSEQGERRQRLLRGRLGHEHDRGCRRRGQSRQPLRRAAPDLHHRKPGAVPARHEPVHRRRRAHGRCGADDGDQVGDERVPRLGVHLRARSGDDGEGLLHGVRRMRRRCRSAASSSADPPAARSRATGCSSSERSNRSTRTRANRCPSASSTSWRCSCGRPTPACCGRDW